MLPPGQIARRILGRHFEVVGKIYRRIFVDLDAIASAFDDMLPEGARIIDIGGGDGALIERLLKRRPDLKVTMCDLAPSIGSFLTHHVTLLPATDFSDVDGCFDYVTISDVIHHVPAPERDAFFKLLAKSCKRWGCRNIILKDIEPGGVRSILSVFADRYISGDRHVVLFPRADFAAVTERHFPVARRTSSMPDWPNYCEALSW